MVKEGTALGARQGRGKTPAAKAAKEEGRVVSGQGWGVPVILLGVITAAGNAP